jgi:HK97 family phage portal protein
MLIRALSQFEKRDGLALIGDVSAYIRHLAAQSKSDDTGARVTESSAMTLPWAYSAINVLSDTLAHVPLELRQKRQDGGSDPASDHPMYELVHDSPSSTMTSFVWRKTMESHRNGWGNGITWIRRRPGSVSLELLYPDRTEMRRLRTGDWVYKTRLDDGSEETILALDVLHVPCMTYDGRWGMSPPAALKLAFAQGLNLQQFGATFFGRGANPRAIIESELGGNNYSQMAKEFKDAWGGLDNAHGTPVLPKGFKYQQVSINPNDAQFLETAKFNRSVIAGIYRVPAHLINDQEKNTFTNAVEMDLSFAKHSMVPIYSAYEQELNRKLLTRSERASGLYFKFNMNGLLRGAQQDRYNAYHLAIQDGWMSRNEARRLEDMSSQDGLDEYLVSQQMTSADAILAPAMSGLASRIARQEQNALSKIGEDPDAAAAFYVKQRDWLRNNVEPIAVQMEIISGRPAKHTTQRFIDRHINQQLALMQNSIAEAIPSISAEDIYRTLCEVIKNG